MLPISATHLDAARAAAVAVDRLGDAEVTLLNADAWFCGRKSRACPSFIDGVPTSVDGVHLTDAASRALGPLITEALDLSRTD
ncbi:hypothetical protein CBP52_16490 [Cellulomonas sp. PSBB021]|nr:SGNH hydrolase domain-containing protein [Cellulomonas sp. PSBB021]ASR56430.1 hypothetical protein CBP52_16490 [Cellulomonas sp. PSBB021]